MKKLFHKAITVLGTLALVGSTMGTAVAASYSDTFGGDSAVVVGSIAAGSDTIAAISIANDLGISAIGATATTTTGSTSVTAEDSYKFEKSSTKFNLGNSFTDLRSTINDEYLPSLLGDGTYTDDDNDEFDFTQKIVPADRNLTLFDDNDYMDDTPTVGFKYSSGDTVLTYTLAFSTKPTFDDLKTTNIPIMGNDYYVLSNGTDVQNPILTFLDSAVDTVLSDGATNTLDVGGTAYAATIEYISTSSVKLNVNGEVTSSLSIGETYKLSDGSYIGVKDILYDAKESGISKVEFSIGQGKLILTDGNEVQLNEDTISGLTAHVTNGTTGTTLVSIGLTWKADDDLFITEDSTITMPGFEVVSLSYGGSTYPAEEETHVDVSNNVFTLTDFPLDDGAASIDLYYINETSGNISGYGSAVDKQLLISDAAASTGIVFNDSEHEYFIASWNDTTDSASYLMRATSFIVESTTVNKTTIQYYKDDSWTDAKVKAQPDDIVTLGDMELTVRNVNRLGKTVNITGNAGTSFNTLYSTEGLAVTLGVNADITNLSSDNVSSMSLIFAEQDKSDNLGNGDTFTATLGSAGTSPSKTASITAVTTSSGSLAYEIGNTDVYRQFAYSALATEALYDKSDSSAKSLTLIYHGSEVANDVYITSSDVVVTAGDTIPGATGQKTFTDAEATAFADKDLIVIGGSCVNTVAAELLGSSTPVCGDAFTTATSVKAGQYMFESFARNGKVALLVAGYDAEDTTKAATHLINKVVDVTVGAKNVYTTANEAVVATA